MADDLDTRCRRLIADLGIAGEVLSVRPLTGGVASDIAVVDMADRAICVKFALAKLKVAQDWRAPVHRNRAEYHWLQVAGGLLPRAAPQLHGRSEAENGFAMEFLRGPDIRLWKTILLAGEAPRGEAIAVARTLGVIHAASARAGFDRTPFDNADDFRALRIEPYLTFTATRHPEVAAQLTALADGLYAARTVLIHGDVSPKNILLRGADPVLLDAECASMGDAAFDVAFCLNHLILKAVHLPGRRGALLAEVAAFWAAYRSHVDWEDAAALGARIAALLPALMLARVDGKSPVEYLDAAEQGQVRRLALALLHEPARSPDDLVAQLGRSIAG